MMNQMTDTEKKIAEIREALEKATPGPWKVKKGEGWEEDYPRQTYIQAVWEKPDHRGCVGYRIAEMSGVNDKTMSNAYLIANSLEWLRFLISELDREREEKRKLWEEIDQQRAQTEFFKEEAGRRYEWYWEMRNDLEEKLQSAQQEIERLREERDAVAEGYRQQVKLAGELMDKLAFVQEREQKLIKKLREITKLLCGVTFTDGRQWGAYNALCDILEENEKELSK